MKRGAVLLVVYNRPTELALVLDAINNSNLEPIKKITLIQQRGNSEVARICSEIDWIECEWILNEPFGNSIKAHINHNVFLGLQLAFKDPCIDWVSVLEDDIVVAKDFFNFVSYIMKEYNENPKFYGINGFSGVPKSLTSTPDKFGEYRFGFGWGWAINRRTWQALQCIWNGEEDAHWDGHIEHLVKTGLVVMPIQSRILNIGFNERASHTKKLEDSVIPEEKKLMESFVTTDYSGNYKKVVIDLNWRNDCRPYIKDPTSLALLISVIYRISFYARPQAIHGKFLQKLTLFIRRICELLLDSFSKIPIK